MQIQVTYCSPHTTYITEQPINVIFKLKVIAIRLFSLINSVHRKGCTIPKNGVKRKSLPGGYYLP